METIYINKERVTHDDVLAWIDANWEDAKYLECTHFEPSLNVSGVFCICSLWMQGMKSVEDWEGMREEQFKPYKNGWLRKHQDFNNYIYYKEGCLFCITSHC